MWVVFLQLSALLPLCLVNIVEYIAKYGLMKFINDGHNNTWWCQKFLEKSGEVHA